MKKSQVLAALALAFALGLGVIAPVASTYATVVNYPANQDVTELQKNLDKEVKASNKAYNQLENVTAYEGLYTDVESITKGLENAGKTMLDLYNTGKWNDVNGREYVNGDSEKFNDRLYETSKANDYIALYRYHLDTDSKKVYDYLKSGRTLAQATLNQLPELAEVTDVKTAYNNVKALYDAANNNKATLTGNYIAAGSSATVRSATKELQSVINFTEMWLGKYSSTYATIGGFTPANYADARLKTIDKKASEDMQKSDAWKKGTPEEQFNMFLTVAKKTPKFNVIKPLVEAKKNFDKINFNGGEAVDYDKAVEYVAAFNAAIKNYHDGKAPVNPDGTGDGTNKPDDEKDPSAPDTGILSNTEASASTTLAMVAGIATALTAAGAGVVAYRNACRSSRK